MFPWTSGAEARAAARRVRALEARTAEQATQEFAELRKLSEAESTFDNVLLSSEDRLSKGHLARTLAEASTPEGTLELGRVWRDVDTLMGPGASVLHTLTARYSSLQSVTTRMGGHLRRLAQTRGAGARRLLLTEMDRELTAFARLKGEILAAVDANTKDIGQKLKAELTKDQLAKAGRISASEVRKECQEALGEFEQSLRDLRKAAEDGIDRRPGTVALKRLTEEQLTTLKAGADVGRRQVLSSRISRLATFGNPMELGPRLAGRLKRAVGRHLPALEEVEDTALMFMEALGVVAQARPSGTKLLRRYAEGGAKALDAAELKRLEGYIGQIAGLLPEEVATKMRFMEGIFYKNAFEVLGDFPPALRGKMSVEMVEGPLWVVGGSGPPRQFGDGCLLITGSAGQSAIVGLGEFKAGFDEGLLTQLFVRSDGRAVNSRVRFLDAKGQVQIRTLTREFSFGEGERVALTRRPVYVYGRPGGETPETTAKFAAMVDDQMRSGREMWKMQLPFSTKTNRYFAEEAVKESVRILTKATAWGR
jgi:hypothetical protein